MPVTIISIFRDSEPTIPNYFAQIQRLEDALGEGVQLVIAEGDSVDRTHNVLYEFIRERNAGCDVLLKVDHGGRKFASVDHPERWHNIALVYNAVLDASPHDGPLILVESDLHWGPATMEQLLEDVLVRDAVAPLSLHNGRFYDIWGHRGLDGERFRMQYPYHPDLHSEDGPLVRISSAGSCIAMRPEVSKVCRFGADDGIVGFCRDMREHDFELWIDKRVQVTHP